MSILAVNVGSSSIKFAIYPKMIEGEVTEALTAGVIEGLEPRGQVRMRYQDRRSDNAWIIRDIEIEAHEDRFQKSIALLHVIVSRSLDGAPLEAVAHRVVHGGGQFIEATRVTPSVLDALAVFSPLAPLHQPHNLEGIRQFQHFYPDVPQVACFDTAFHASLPEEEVLFALPPKYAAEGIRRYGFHGLSYAYLKWRLDEQSQLSSGRVLMAHLGSGASLCAMREGRSVATTMGFSALDGLMMGTRSGAIDPGVILHWLRQGKATDAIEQLLYKESGLLGVSGESADFRTLRSSKSEAARRAIRLFTYRVRRESGALISVLGGLDILVFTGGIGEHDSILRSEVVAGLSYLGIEMDPDANARADGQAIAKISRSSSSVEVWVIPTDEGRMAASAAARLIGTKA